MSRYFIVVNALKQKVNFIAGYLLCKYRLEVESEENAISNEFVTELICGGLSVLTLAIIFLFIEQYVMLRIVTWNSLGYSDTNIDLLIWNALPSDFDSSTKNFYCINTFIQFLRCYKHVEQNGKIERFLKIKYV